MVLSVVFSIYPLHHQTLMEVEMEIKTFRLNVHNGEHLNFNLQVI